MNIKVTNTISDIPSCCISLGVCGSSLTLEHGIPHPPKIYILMPQADTAWKLAPVPLKPVGFQVLVSQQGAITPTQNPAAHSTEAPH